MRMINVKNKKSHTDVLTIDELFVFRIVSDILQTAPRHSYKQLE